MSRPPPPVPREARAATREQLLDTAAEVFAEVGFRQATVRDICRRAKANVAAVNYHFGDKQAFYAEVMKEAMRSAREKYPPDLGVALDDPPERRLRAFIRSLLLRIFDQGPMACRGRLLLREMAEPTAALDALVAEELRPMASYLMRLVGELLGPDAPPETVRRCGISVVSQIVFYNHCRAALTRLFPDLRCGLQAVEVLTEHITAFSLAGLRVRRARAPRRGGVARRRRS